MEKLYAAVVMYNSEITDSETCKNLVNIKNHDIIPIIVDNSTVSNKNKYLCAKRGWHYISMNGNKGLSRAYNSVLDYLQSKSGIVIWFDDDTNVTQEYFDVLEKSILAHEECSVFVPVMQGQDGKFWSPNKARFFKNKQMKSLGDTIPNSQFNAINSCTAVKLNVYNDYRYNEKLFLDQVDHNFFEDQRNLRRKFCKMNIVIQHNFSTRNLEDNIDKIKPRYKIMIPDFLTFCSKNRIRYTLGVVKVLGWGVRESIRYKDVSFLFWCVGEIRKYPYKQN